MIYLPIPKVCSVQDCARPSAWAPLFSLRPPASTGYTGKPMQATPALGICDGHRAWFLEAGFRDWLPTLASQASAMGLAVDHALTTCELVPIGPPPGTAQNRLAEHLL